MAAGIGEKLAGQEASRSVYFPASVCCAATTRGFRITPMAIGESGVPGIEGVCDRLAVAIVTSTKLCHCWPWSTRQPINHDHGYCLTRTTDEAVLAAYKRHDVRNDSINRRRRPVVEARSNPSYREDPGTRFHGATTTTTTTDFGAGTVTTATC